MAGNSEGASRTKGLSFIDWDILDQDEFNKLDKIINMSSDSTGVQFPFMKGISGPDNKSQALSTKVSLHSIDQALEPDVNETVIERSVSDPNDNVAPKSPKTASPNVKNSEGGLQKEIEDVSNPKHSPTLPPPPKMWSSLFNTSNRALKQIPTVSDSPPTFEQPPTNNSQSVPQNSSPDVKSVRYWQEQEKLEQNDTKLMPGEKLKPVRTKQDPLAPKLLEQLINFPISHTPIVIQPRGLKNSNNICFMNATLQVLMGCPPFVHMFRAFKSFPTRELKTTSTPVFDSLVQFVNSFQNGQRIRHQGQRNKRGNNPEIPVGASFYPEPLVDVAQHILGLNIGVQHDAEEFLSQILSICNEELENVLKLKSLDGINNNKDVTVTSTKRPQNGYLAKTPADETDGDDSDEAWQKVGPKNHSVETNVNDCGETPLSNIFAGLSRSSLVRESGKVSDTLDSFFTLKLDIQPENVHSVKDALLRLNTSETVHDADGRKIQGQRRMFFDVLPPVLIMHLKLFEYTNGNGQKIQKKITFDVDLQTPKEILSRVGRSKYSSLKSRSYKLFGVVNHHGIKMNDGHYTSDVYLPVASGWLHFDDRDVSSTNEANVLQYCERSMPYLLFYRRMDLS